jgi:hypothetical protein
MQQLLKGVGCEKDNPIRTNRDNSTKILLYNPKSCVYKIVLIVILVLKQRCKSSI